MGVNGNKHSVLFHLLCQNERFHADINNSTDGELSKIKHTEDHVRFAHAALYRVSNKKSYSSFWLVFKNTRANLIQIYHGRSLKDGKNHSHKSKQLGRVTTSGMRLA